MELPQSFVALFPGSNLRALNAVFSDQSSNECGFEGFGIMRRHVAWVADLILKHALECCLSGALHSEIKASYVM